MPDVENKAQVPAARRALAALRLLASSAEPLAASAIARSLGIPRSSTYHLLAEMADEGFVTYLPEQRRWGLGVVAFEIGSAYLRQGSLERLARPLLARLCARTGEIVQLGVLHGAETLYLLKEQPSRPSAHRPPAGSPIAHRPPSTSAALSPAHRPPSTNAALPPAQRPPSTNATLVTDVGVRMPAHLTASGRSMLAHLPAAQVRALFPGALVDRTGRGPRTLRELRRMLAEDARRGWSAEDGYITEGLATIAACAFDHVGHPTAAIAVTFRRETRVEPDWPALANQVTQTAKDLTRRLGGPPNIRRS